MLNGGVWMGGYRGVWVPILVVVIVGLLVPGCLLSPMVAALAMSLNLVLAIGEALRLRQVRTAPAEPGPRSGLFATSSSHGR
jgi:cation transport ATPase